MCLGIPGLIVEVSDPIRKLAVVDVGGVKRTVNISCIVNEEHSAASCLGDWVLVHVGFAMSRIDAGPVRRYGNTARRPHKRYGGDDSIGRRINHRNGVGTRRSDIRPRPG